MQMSIEIISSWETQTPRSVCRGLPRENEKVSGKLKSVLRSFDGIRTHDICIDCSDNVDDS